MRPPRVYRHVPFREPPHKGQMLLGLCDREEEAIYINPKQSDREMLISGTHEMIHYIFPKRSERLVERDGILIGDVLWKLGYRSRKRKSKI